MRIAMLRKAWADLSTNRLQNLLICIILMLATVALTVSLVVLRSADDPWMRTHDKANGAHIWMAGTGGDQDFSILAEQPEVAETSGEIKAISANPMMLNGEQINIFIYGMDERPPVATPLLADGRWVQPGTASEVVLDFSYAQYYDLNVGDTVDILTPNGLKNFEVVGTAVSTHWFSYDENLKDQISGIVYVSAANIGVLEPDPTQWREVFGIRLQDPESSKAYIPSVYALMNNQLESTIEWQWLRELSTLTNTIIVLFMGMFSILGLISVGFIIGNAISGQMLAQYREIGMLKAIGFKPMQVTALFLLENLLMGSAAAVLGLVIGMAIGPAFASPMAELLNTTPTAVYDPVLALIILAVILGAVALFTVFPAWRASRIDTIRAITVGQRETGTGVSRLGSLASKLNLPMSITVGVKDVFSHPFRTLSSIAGLVITIVVVVFAIGAQSTIGDLTKNSMFFQSTSSDMKIDRNFLPEAETRELLAAQPEIETYYTYHDNFSWAVGHEDSPIYVEALADDWQAFDFTVKEGRMIERDGEALVGYGVQQLLDLELGDEFVVMSNGKPLHLKAVGFLAEQIALGNSLRFTLATYQQQVNPDATVNFFALDLASGTDRAALADRLEVASHDQFSLIITNQEPNLATLQLRDTAWSLSMLLLIIGVVNLLSMSLLSIRERARDFGIQKAIGFTPRQISMSVVANVAVVVIMALIIGTPLSLLAFDQMMSNIGVQVGSGPEFGTMSYAGLLILIPLMGIVALAGSYLPARRATQVQVAEVLRYE